LFATNLGHDAHRGKDQHIDFRVRQEPEQVLPEKRVASAGVVRTWPLTTRPLGRKKLVPADDPSAA